MLDIFIVDDEVWVTKLISKLIDWEALGFRIAGIYHDGMDAIESMKQLCPQLVLTDIKMPGMSGLEMIKEAAACELATSFIVISGHNDFEYAKTALTYGAVGYLLKPIDQNELVEVVTRAKAMISRAAKDKQDQYEMVETLDRALEKARRDFFMHGFHHASENREENLSQINQNLHVAFEPGCFRVVTLLVQSACDMDEMSCRFNHALDAQGLQDACIELLTFVDDPNIICVMNYAQEANDDILAKIKTAFLSAMAERAMGAVTMGIGRPVREICKCNLSYQTAQEAVTFRWVKESERIFESNAENEDNEIAAFCTLNMELSLRTALRDCNLPLLIRLINELFMQAGLRVQKNPRVMILCVYWFIDLCEDIFISQFADHDDQTNYLKEKRKQLENCFNLDAVKDVLVEIAKKIIDEKQQVISTDKNKALIWEAVHYVDRNFMQDISLSEIAEVVRLNPNYFCTLFRAEMQLTFMEYLTQKRIDSAKKLLKTSKYRLSEIADMVGYNDVKHFSNMFRKTVGITPSEYRKIMVGYE